MLKYLYISLFSQKISFNKSFLDKKKYHVDIFFALDILGAKPVNILGIQLKAIMWKTWLKMSRSN